MLTKIYCNKSAYVVVPTWFRHKQQTCLKLRTVTNLTCATAYIKQCCHVCKASQMHNSLVQHSCCGSVHLEEWIGWHLELEVFQHLCQVCVPKQMHVWSLICGAPCMWTAAERWHHITHVLPRMCSFILIYGLINSAVSSSGDMVSNSMTICKTLVKTLKWLWPNLR